MDKVNISTINNDAFYDLLYSGNTILLGKSDMFSVVLKTVHNWQLIFIFKKNPDKKKFGVDVVFESNNHITLTQWNWDADDYVEYTTPQIIESADKKTKIQVRMRSRVTIASRIIDLSIWQYNKEAAKN